MAGGRTWARRACVGIAVVLVGMLLVPICMKLQDFLGSWFGGPTLALEFAAVVFGSAFVGFATWKSNHRATWQGKAVLAWAAVGVASPLLAYVFLLAWGFMFLTSPGIIWIARQWWRA